MRYGRLFQDVFNKTKKFANNAVDETKDAAQKAKLNNKIGNEIQMIDREYGGDRKVFL